MLYRYSDGTVKLRNPHIELMDQDILYHLALGSGSHDLVEMFGDVKVITHLLESHGHFSNQSTVVSVIFNIRIDLLPCSTVC